MRRQFADNQRTFAWALHAAGAAVVALLVGGYVVLLERPLATQRDADAQRYDQLAEQLRSSSQVRTHHVQLRREVADLQSRGQRLRTRFAQPLDSDRLTQDLRQLAKRHHLHVDRLSVGKPQQSGSFRQSEIRLQCDGSFASICQLVDGLQRVAWITDITQLHLEVDGSGPSYTVLARFTVYSDQTIPDSDKT